MADTIKVKATGDSHKVAFYEKSDAHPNGQAFVAHDGKTHEVGETPAVDRAIAAGILEKVSGRGGRRKASTTEDAPESEDTSE